MSITTTDITSYLHPDYTKYFNVWSQMSDTYEGERVIKSKSVTYLKPTPGMTADLNNASTKVLAQDRYNNYLNKAIYYNYFGDSINSMLGVMHSNSPALIKLPSELTYLEKNITSSNGSIETLLSDLNKQQLINGRVGIFLDPTVKGFKVFQYNAPSILNWSYAYVNGEIKLEFVLLNETGLERSGLTYDEVEKYRLCALDADGNYYSKILKSDELNEIDIQKPTGNFIYPKAKGKISKEVPFIFINSTDNLPDISNPPLENLSNLGLHLYNGEADYRQFLYQLSQDTLFIKGFEESELEILRVGAGSMIATTNPDAEAKFVGINSQGLSESRTSLENLHKNSIALGLALIDSSTVGESGKALAQRTFTKTVKITPLAKAAANGVRNLLQIGANWINIPSDIEIIPNLNFTGFVETAVSDLIKLWNAKIENNFPIDNETFTKQLSVSTGIETSNKSDIKPPDITTNTQ